MLTKEKGPLPKKIVENSREKNFKLSIPQATHRKPIKLKVVVSVNIAIIEVQVAVPSGIGIGL